MLIISKVTTINTIFNLDVNKFDYIKLTPLVISYTVHFVSFLQGVVV